MRFDGDSEDKVAGRKPGWLVLHLLVSFWWIGATFLPRTAMMEMLVPAIGLGVGTGVSLFLVRRSPYRKWAGVLLSIYAGMAFLWVVAAGFGYLGRLVGVR